MSLTHSKKTFYSQGKRNLAASDDDCISAAVVSVIKNGCQTLKESDKMSVTSTLR